MLFRSVEFELTAHHLSYAAEDGTEAVSLMASPYIADPPVGEDVLAKVFADVDAAALEAQTKITEARKEVTDKLNATRKYAPETRKTALLEFSKMQTKLTEAQRKLNPFKSFKKEFHVRVEARKALADMTEKLTEAEAASYFVGDGCCAEDKGFAITPFTNVEWDNKIGRASCRERV